MKYFPRIFTALSIGFVFFYLVNNWGVSAPPVFDVKFLIISFIFLIIGFFAQSICWWLALRLGDVKVALKIAVYSVCRSILGKYIPGKIWMIVGRAALVSQLEGGRLTQIYMSSLVAQLMTLLVGACAVMYCLSDVLHKVGEVNLPFGMWCLFALCVLIVGWYGKRWLALGVFFVQSNIKLLIAMLCVSVVMWSMLGVGFYCLAYGMGHTLPFAFMILAFAAASTVGIVSFVAPGGLGVREGALVFVLVGGGMGVADASGLAIIARVWFLIGELFVFFVSFWPMIKCSSK